MPEITNTLFPLPPEGYLADVLTLPGYRKPTPATARIQIEDLQAEIAGLAEQMTYEPWRNLGGIRREALEGMIAKREAKIAELTEIIEAGYVAAEAREDPDV